MAACVGVCACQALRNMGLSGDDGQLLHLLKAADYNLERAVNLYEPPPSLSLPSPHHFRTSLDMTTRRATGHIVSRSICRCMVW